MLLIGGGRKLDFVAVAQVRPMDTSALVIDGDVDVGDGVIAPVGRFGPVGNDGISIGCRGHG